MKEEKTETANSGRNELQVKNFFAEVNGKFKKAELIEDIEFLADRIHLMGKFTCDEPRSWGASSNSLLEIAYGVRKVEDVILPSDQSDLTACGNLVALLPLHRKINRNVYDAYDKQLASKKDF